jgi:phage FluMu protein Com
MINNNPYIGDKKLEHVRFVSVVFCGRCEKEFLIKLKPDVAKPTYECPGCKVVNKFEITWK